MKFVLGFVVCLLSTTSSLASGNDGEAGFRLFSTISRSKPAFESVAKSIPGRDEAPTRTMPEVTEPWCDDNWEFTLAPYVWATWMDVESGLGEINLEPQDIVDSLEFGFMLSGEARRNRFGIFFDSVYMQLGETGNALNDLVNFSVEFKQFMAQLGGYYRLGDRDLFFDLMGSARYVSLEGTFDPQNLSSRSVGENWFEPVIGGRITKRLGDRWYATGRGDVGGFGIGEASDLSWQLMAILGYEISNAIDIGIGFRYFDMDYDRSFTYDQQAYGPFLGATFSF